MARWRTDVLIIGAVVSLLAIAFFTRDKSGLVFRVSPNPDGLRSPRSPTFGIYLKELVKSNLNVARIVISPDLPLNPGIVKVRTKLKTAMGRMLLANSITLTPGTLTVEMDGEWLYIHWVTVDSPDIEAATASIVGGFERYLEVMYG